MSIQSVNPATGEVIETLEPTSAAQVEQIVAGAHAAFLEWRTQPWSRRSALMHKAAAELRARQSEYAAIMTREMGKPIVQSEAEVEKCAGTCDYYAEHAEAFLAEQTRETDASRSYVRFDPLGVVLAVMPWNFPFWQVFRFAAPALMAGNAGVLKHASNVPRCALAIEEVFRRAGFPSGLFRTVLVGRPGGEGADRGPAHRGRHPHRERARRAARWRSRPGASSRRRSWSWAAAIRSSCWPTRTSTWPRRGRRRRASSTAARAASRPSGSSWWTRWPTASWSASREELASRRMGDPTDRDTQVGPQARVDLRDELHQQVEESVKRGARALLGGAVPAGRGAFYPPTLLVDGGPRHARLRRGDLRPGGRGDPRQGRGGRDPARQRLLVRPGRLAVDARPRPRRAPRARRSRRARSSSTAWSSPIRAYPSAASSAPATGASCPSTASASSST